MKHVSTLSDFLVKIKPDQLKWLARMGRDTAIEPFFGNPGLELVQSAKSGLEKGMDAALGWGSKTKGWLGKKKWVHQAKTAFDETKSQFSQSGSARWFIYLEKATQEIRNTATALGSKLGDKTGDLTLLALKKGLELVMYEDTEKWALERASLFFPHKRFSQLSDMAQLREAEREQLIAHYYPYDHPALKRFAKSLDVSFNLALGVTAASQLPGTGVAAGALNLIKTLTKLAGRVSSMSAIYGFAIPTAEHLFFFCAQILKSIEDFESNPDHEPLHPASMAPLYSTQSLSGSGFGDMLKEALKKEAYMAVPGVGAISMGKIGLDDLMVDQMILHLVSNYFWYSKLVEEQGQEPTDALITRWQQIYRGLIQNGWFDRPSTGETREPWFEKLAFWGVSDAVKQRSVALDQKASELFEQSVHLDEAEFRTQLANWVKL